MQGATLLVALCILRDSHICVVNDKQRLINVAEAFSSPPIIGQPRIHAHRSTSTTLHEQPVNRREILGPISPSTVAKYNLPPDVIAEGWSAQLVSRSATTVDNQTREADRILGKVTTEIQLIPKDPREHYVGTVRVEVPIPLDAPGLGIELLELEGGREDGLGIVVVNGLVPGGNAEKAVAGSARVEVEDRETIMCGDTIIAAELVLQRGDATDIRSIKTECLDYDSTVEALVGMLAALDGGDVREASVVVTLKRLRRRPNLRVKLHYPPEQNLPSETLQVAAGDNLRTALLQRGVKLNDPLAQRYDGKSYSGNCGGGSLCRTCAVSVLRGGELLSLPKDNERKMMDDAPRWRLACKSWVGYGMKEGEVVIQVNPRQW